MYFINKPEELIGKRVVHVRNNQFQTDITIMTEDKGILILTVDEWKVKPLPEHRAKQILDFDPGILLEFRGLGFISDEELKEYQKKREQEQEAMRKQFREQQEKLEKERLRVLLDKYGIPDDWEGKS
jgi:hypothetical protein